MCRTPFLLLPLAATAAAKVAKLQKLATEIEQAKITAASTHISAWVQKELG
jgi:hypothetical protein